MSLINKMLRDLDARHAAPGATTMPKEVRPLAAETPRPRARHGLPALFAIIAVAAAAGLLTQAAWLPELQALLAHGVVPAMQEGHHFFAKALLVFSAV